MVYKCVLESHFSSISGREGLILSKKSKSCTVLNSRDQWCWQNFMNSMCGIKFWKGNDLRSVYKNRFSKFWAVASIFDLFQLSKKFIVPSKRWKLFSFNRSNGASPFFPTDFINVHMTLVKSAPKKVLAKKLFYQFLPKKSVFWAKLFLGALFTKVICTFFKSVWKDGFFDTTFDLIKEKKLSSFSRVSVYLLWNKKPKMEATTQYFGKCFFINRS